MTSLSQLEDIMHERAMTACFAAQNSGVGSRQHRRFHELWREATARWMDALDAARPDGNLDAQGGGGT